mgnify:CR=1 FL=1
MTTPFDEVAPRLSPDGGWIAHGSDESGTYDICLRPFPGPGAQIPVSVCGGNSPVWSHDSRRVFHLNADQLIAASVETNPSFSVTAREVLFAGNYLLNLGHATFDSSRDGKSLLMLRLVGRNHEEIVWVHNWTAELRARAKGTGQR